jgi:hypothetical protein
VKLSCLRCGAFAVWLVAGEGEGELGSPACTFEGRFVSWVMEGSGVDALWLFRSLLMVVWRARLVLWQVSCLEGGRLNPEDPAAGDPCCWLCNWRFSGSGGVW